MCYVGYKKMANFSLALSRTRLDDDDDDEEVEKGQNTRSSQVTTQINKYIYIYLGPHSESPL